MPEVKQVTIQISPSSRNNPEGVVSFGYYVLENGKLTMTDGNGVPVCGKHGDLTQHTMKPGDDPDFIARCFTRDIRLRIHGDSAGFNRRLDYPVWRPA
jgi:hypothetical protein